MKELDYRSETFSLRVQEQIGKKAERRLYNKAKEPSD